MRETPIVSTALLATGLILILVLVWGCGGGSGDGTDDVGARGAASTTPTGSPWFEDVAGTAGLEFTWQSGHRDKFYLPEITGGGAALFDMDGDGDLDAYLVQCGSVVADAAKRPPNQLFRNDGAGRFEDVTAGSGADDRGCGMGVACGDYDNDGDVDVYVTNVGPNVLLRNEGDGRFTDATTQAGVGDRSWGASAAFADLDGDGYLDLFVTNYLNWTTETEIDCYNDAGMPDYCAPVTYQAPATDVVYRNNGDGTFTDVTSQMGFNTASGTGLGVIAGDFTGDGVLEVFVANDGMPDVMWTRSDDGRYRNSAMMMSCALDEEGKPKAGMGVAAEDIDQDGDLDFIVCNLRREADSLYRNDGLFFTDITRPAGLGRTSRTYTRFGMGWADFDNDGALDLYQANGRVQNKPPFPDGYDGNVFAEPNLLYQGAPGPKFTEVRPQGGTGETLVHNSRAAAFGDVDDDGGIDVLVTNIDAPAYLLRNVVTEPGHWIKFRVMERGRDAYNARVSVGVGNTRVTRETRAAYSYQASNDPRAHFGLGGATRVTGVTVRWPDGTEERFGDFAADQVVTLVRGEG